MNLGVREDRHLIVTLEQYRIEELHFLYGACYTFGLDQVADFKRLEENENHRRGKVLDRLLQRKAKDDYGHTRKGKQCFDWETNHSQYGNNGGDPNTVKRKRDGQVHHQLGELGLFQDRLQLTPCERGEPPPHEKDYESHPNAQRSA